MAVHNNISRKPNLSKKVLTKSDLPVLSEELTSWSDQHIVLFMVRINFDRMVKQSFDGQEREVDFSELDNVESTIKLRKAFKAFQYGNNRGFGTQSSPFDKWSYELSSKRLLDMHDTYIGVWWPMSAIEYLLQNVISVWWPMSVIEYLLQHVINHDIHNIRTMPVLIFVLAEI